MAFKRRAEPTTVEDERAALREQHAALEDLKRQLSERVDAVRERELELHHALAEAGNPTPAGSAARSLPALPGTAASRAAVPGADTGDGTSQVQSRERAVAERERAVAA